MGKTQFRLAPATAVCVSLLFWATAHAQVTTYRSESDFTAAANRSGYATFGEGFEDGAVWGAARAPNAVPAVTSNGIVWTSNHPTAISRPSEITTGPGAAHTGQYGVFSSPHGDPDATSPFGVMRDGFIGTRSAGAKALYGVGGWFTGMFGSRVDLILDGDEANRIELGPAGNDFQFFGVISTSPFTKFEFREVEGRLEDQKFIFADDFTFVTGGETVLQSVSAASFAPNRPLAPGLIAAAFGSGLAATAESASSVPLPTTLAGATLLIRDAAGIEREAPLFYVGPNQINFEVPMDVAPGPATLAVVRAGQGTAFGKANISPVSPGLFTANADGSGVPAAIALTVAANGAESVQYAYQCGAAAGSCVTAPIDLGIEGDQVYLVLFVTGIRGRIAMPGVTIGGTAAEVTYAGAQGTMAGLDQVNVRLPRSLAGRGDVEVRLNVDGLEANPVRLNIR